MNVGDIEAVLESHDRSVRELVSQLRALVRQTVPDAVEEPDTSANLIGYTFQPGTYKGLIVAIAPHASHVNLMFAKGAELVEVDRGGLLEGTGKKARHVTFRDSGDVSRAEVRVLIEQAARRTPRG